MSDVSALLNGSKIVIHRLRGFVIELSVQIEGEELVFSGVSPTYYLKQVAGSEFRNLAESVGIKNIRDEIKVVPGAEIKVADDGPSRVGVVSNAVDRDPIHCGTMYEKLVRYVFRDLIEQEREEVSSHLASCIHCAAKAAALEDALEIESELRLHKNETNEQ